MRKGGRILRILLAKAGLDGHDRGVKIVACALRDANMEVIYTGRRQSAEQIINAAIEEDVDAIGISTLSGAHQTIFSKVLGLLEKEDSRDIAVFGGGIIPNDDADALKERGVLEIFGPGSNTGLIVEKLTEMLADKMRIR